MDNHELEALLSDLESDRVERKASAADIRKIRRTICAFANDLPNHQQPGVIFVGVNDDGDLVHLPITDAFLTCLANIRSEGNIQPLPSMTVQKRTLRGGELAVIIVNPSDAPPVRCRGRVWVRVGPRLTVATAEKERRTDYRNLHLAEAMRNLGYVQRFGVGIPIARKSLKENDNPPPEFVAQDTHLLVSIRRRP